MQADLTKYLDAPVIDQLNAPPFFIRNPDINDPRKVAAGQFGLLAIPCHNTNCAVMTAQVEIISF